MNFVPGQIENGSIRTSFGEFRLPDERWETVRRNNPSREVVVGIRPEHFEDADLLDPTQRETGVTFSAEVDVLESMGSDKFAYFTAEGPGVHSKDLDELAADAGADMSPNRWSRGCRWNRRPPRAGPCSCGSTRRRSRCSIRRPARTSPSDKPTSVDPTRKAGPDPPNSSAGCAAAEFVDDLLAPHVPPHESVPLARDPQIHLGVGA